MKNLLKKCRYKRKKRRIKQRNVYNYTSLYYIFGLFAIVFGKILVCAPLGGKKGGKKAKKIDKEKISVV